MSQADHHLVSVHIGHYEPSSRSDEQESREAHLRANLDWQRYGLEPRWLGEDSSECPVALMPRPSLFPHGEWARFLDGARQRGETALVIRPVGELPRSVLSFLEASVADLGTGMPQITHQRLPMGIRPQIAADLGGADHDLALRLISRPENAPWWSLRFTDGRELQGDRARVVREARGEFHPLIHDSLGQPVAAVWTSESMRLYVIPDIVDWRPILGWLQDKALPEFVPGALRRARAAQSFDPDLQSAEETAARQALDELDARYATDLSRLEQALREVVELVEPIRDGLLFGTGKTLVEAVANVLTAAGIETIDLDEKLGATRSADLLARGPSGTPQRLVEVKSSSGAASERLVSDLQRHLTTWPAVSTEGSTAGGVLIVNHQRRLHPAERTSQVYSRPEFVETLPVTVLSTVQLLRWWCASDWAAIRAGVLGTG